MRGRSDLFVFSKILVHAPGWSGECAVSRRRYDVESGDRWFLTVWFVLLGGVCAWLVPRADDDIFHAFLVGVLFRSACDFFDDAISAWRLWFRAGRS
jgi:hypothetical protein